ncbi:MAG: hypothetical protein M9931_00360 [Chitinophagales bacterium]|nr:hypothetical protein [Chitinophagales bacterium]
MKIIYTAFIFSIIAFTLNSCTQNRCSCTDGYTVDVQNSSQKVAKQACASIEGDRQIISKNTKCSLQ